jgi:hypothetical protein
MYFPRVVLLECDLDGCGDSAVLPADRCPPRIGVHVVVHPLADEVLRRWFPRLQACYGAMGVMGADAVTVTVHEPTQLLCTARDAIGTPRLLSLLDLFNPRRLVGGC